MAHMDAELTERFAPPNAALPPDVMHELQSIMRLHSISPQELFYKWESYCIKMDAFDMKLTTDTARDLKRDLNDTLDRQVRGKANHPRMPERKAAAAMPRNTGADVFGLMEGIVPDTPRAPMNHVDGNSAKRKHNFETPVGKSSKSHAKSSPQTSKDAMSAAHGALFSERENAGAITYTLNEDLEIPSPLSTPFAEPRVVLKANTDLSKFSYKPMAMKLSGASEILDDRIDAFVEVVQDYHELDDGAFGNPAAQSTNEIVAVGRITSDNGEGKLNDSSILLETSRKMGGGLRVPLRLDSLPGYDLFPGKIVAVRGNNASGESFSVSSILDLPLPNLPASTSSELDAFKLKLDGGINTSDDMRPLNVLISSGPYTSETNLEYEPLLALCELAKEACADALILVGPFLDAEHPLLASGEIPPISPAVQVSSDSATLTDVFHSFIGFPLQRLAQSLPSITIIMVPSVRDAVNKHVSWPQEKMARSKKELGLPKQVALLTNPVLISLNEILFGISSQDTLFDLSHERYARGDAKPGPSVDFGSRMSRLSRHIIEQRHFYPLFPPMARNARPKPSQSTLLSSETNKAIGSMLDISYLALGEWQIVRPDVLITPSVLEPFAAGVEGTIVVNPGTLSKRRGPGTFVRMTVGPREWSEEELEQSTQHPETLFGHNAVQRSRVDVIKI